MSEITKEELMAMIDVQGKSASAMENIANSVRQMTEQSKEVLTSQKELVKIVAEHTEACKISICEVVDKRISEAEIAAADNKKVIDRIDKNIWWTKIAASVVAVTTAIALALMQFVHWISHNIPAK